MDNATKVAIGLELFDAALDYAVARVRANLAGAINNFGAETPHPEAQALLNRCAESRASLATAMAAKMDEADKADAEGKPA